MAADWQALMTTYHPQAPVPPNRSRRGLVRRIILWAGVATLFALAALLMGTIVGSEVGTTGSTLAAVAASFAIGIVVPTFLWVDRLEAEPPRLLWFAFLWGALVATLGALVLNELGVYLADRAHLVSDPTVFAAVVVAPVAEETMKGLGVLLVFLFARREFNGVTDGIVYAGLSAAGFAFTENILYLGRAFTEFGTGGLVGLFIARVLFSPFAHPMFTVCTGIGLGVLSQRRSWSSAWVVVVGLTCAIFLHGLWNYSAVIAAESILLVYLLVQVPLFFGFLLLLRWTRRRESRMVGRMLEGYARNGWFTPAEVAMIADPGERRRARAWAASVGGRPARRAMHAFQDESGELAMVRRHLDSGPVAGPELVEWQGRERSLLDALTAHRRVFVPGL